MIFILYPVVLIRLIRTLFLFNRIYDTLCMVDFIKGERYAA